MNYQTKSEETAHDSEIHQHIADLTHSDKRVRREADARLRREGAAAYPALLAQFEKEREFSTSGAQLLHIMGHALALIGTIIAIFGLAAVAFLRQIPWGLRLWAIGLPLFTVGIILRNPSHPSSLRLGAAYRFLRSVNDLRLIQALIARYSPEQLWQNPEALALLETLIARITPEYWNTLFSQEKETLLHLIQQQSVTDRKESQRFAMKGLQILKTVGANEATATIAHIAKYGMSQRVRDAALQWQTCMNMPQTDS